MGKIPWRREWLLAPVFLPGESHGQRSLAGCSPWGRTEPDRTEVTDAGLFLPLREAAAMEAVVMVEAAVEAAMEAAITVEAAVAAAMEAAMEAATVTVEAAVEAAAEAAVAAPGPAGYVLLIYCRQRWGPWWSLLRTLTPRSS